jgi:hypothetical protein
MIRRTTARTIELPKEFPAIITLCGSTRFAPLFKLANMRLTKLGVLVFSIGIDTKSDADLIAAGEITEQDKQDLDDTHKRKIYISDAIMVLNAKRDPLDKEGYVGSSTESEIWYAIDQGKFVYWWYPDIIPERFERSLGVFLERGAIA